MKKKIISAVSAAVLCAALLSGCSDGSGKDSAANNEKPSGSNGGEIVIGSITKSHVISADQTAAAIKNTAEIWMMDMETNGVIIPSDEVMISISGRGENITVNFPDEGFTYSGSLNYEYIKEELKKALVGSFNFSNEMSAIVIIKDRKAVGAAYSETLGLDHLESHFTARNFETGIYNWGSNSNGIEVNGDIVGTNPQLIIN